MNNKTLFISIAVLIILALGAYALMLKVPSQPAALENEQGSSQNQNQKLNIDVVCESAHAYMSFTDGEAAAQFVAECKAGEHPEVIERYKADMGLGAGAQI